MRKILLDTYAWVEYLEGSEEGKRVRDLLEGEDTEIYTSVLTIAELSDAFHRGGLDADLEWSDIQDFVQINSSLISLEAEEMADAGALKVERRKEFDDFGLMDAIILISSRKTDAELLSGDPHLTGEENALSLGS